jgi:hypothetical protein
MVLGIALAGLTMGSWLLFNLAAQPTTLARSVDAIPAASATNQPVEPHPEFLSRRQVLELSLRTRRQPFRRCGLASRRNQKFTAYPVVRTEGPRRSENLNHTPGPVRRSANLLSRLVMKWTSNFTQQTLTDNEARRRNMPGRPRMMLKRLNELLQLAEDYGTKLYTAMPTRYREHPDSNDPMCVAWRHAARSAIENYQALDAVRARVAEKVARAERQKGIVESDRR